VEGLRSKARNQNILVVLCDHDILGLLRVGQDLRFLRYVFFLVIRKE
jgi:hypothetical protein